MSESTTFPLKDRVKFPRSISSGLAIIAAAGLTFGGMTALEYFPQADAQTTTTSILPPTVPEPYPPMSGGGSSGGGGGSYPSGGGSSGGGGGSTALYGGMYSSSGKTELISDTYFVDNTRNEAKIMGKDGHSVSSLNSPLEMRVVITNFIKTPLNNVTVSTADGNNPLDLTCYSLSNKDGLNNTISSLGVNEFSTCKASVTSSSVAGQGKDFKIKISGEKSDGSTIELSPIAYLYSLDGEASVESSPLKVVTKINGDDANNAPGVKLPKDGTKGATVDVTNTGNKKIVDIGILKTTAEGRLGSIVCPKTELSPEETMQCRTLINETLFAQGKELAKVYGREENSSSYFINQDIAYYTVDVSPSLEVVKTINGDDKSRTSPGIKVPSDSNMNIEFSVKNTGNVPLYNVNVQDTSVNAGDIRCQYTGGSSSGGSAALNILAQSYEGGSYVNTISSLGVGQTVTCTANIPTLKKCEQHKGESTATGRLQPLTGLPSGGGYSGGSAYALNVLEPSPEPLPPTSMTVKAKDAAYAYSDQECPSSISIVKDINGDPADNSPGVEVVSGSTMNVSMFITNTGESVLKNVKLEDNTIPREDILCNIGTQQKEAPTWPATESPTMPPKVKALNLLNGGAWMPIPADGYSYLNPGQTIECKAQISAPEPGKPHKNIATVTGTSTFGIGETVKSENPAHAFVKVPDVPPAPETIVNTVTMTPTPVTETVTITPDPVVSTVVTTVNGTPVITTTTVTLEPEVSTIVKTPEPEVITTTTVVEPSSIPTTDPENPIVNETSVVKVPSSVETSSAEETSSPQPEKRVLAHTGANVTNVLGAGILLVLVAVGAIAMGRRRD